jgi:hypothetical protein
MSIAKMSPEQIRAAGMQALLRELGPAGLIRFLQQFETGAGDYSVERHSWLPAAGAMDLADRIRAARKPQEDPGTAAP